VRLLRHKCLPILLYALEVSNLDRRTVQSLDYILNRFFMKSVKMSNLELVRHCQTVFGCELPSVCYCRSDVLNLLKACQLIIAIVKAFPLLSSLYRLVYIMFFLHLYLRCLVNKDEYKTGSARHRTYSGSEWEVWSPTCTTESSCRRLDNCEYSHRIYQ